MCELAHRSQNDASVQVAAFDSARGGRHVAWVLYVMLASFQLLVQDQGKERPAKIKEVALYRPGYLPKHIHAVQSRTTMATALGMENRTLREPLTPEERKRFEAYVAEIFSRLGMDVTQIGTRNTPSRWLTALWDMTEGYDGDPKLGAAVSRRMSHVSRTRKNACD